jgi:hypothetical protein
MFALFYKRPLFASITALALFSSANSNGAVYVIPALLTIAYSPASQTITETY